MSAIGSRSSPRRTQATFESKLDRCKELLLEIMSAESRVLSDPAAAVFVMNAQAAGVDLTAWCWVNNADWLGTRSDLW